MSDADRLLDLIEEGIVTHGSDLGGWTRRADGTLQLFDGRVTLRCELRDEEDAREGTVHSHVLATLHERDDEVLDACLFGMGEGRKEALAQAAMVWITCVAGPIRSFIDGRPICMTCQAGVDGGDASEGYSQGDYGLPGLLAYVGPAFSRGLDDGRILPAIDDTKPWFRFAAESAAPRSVHLAKATVVCKGDEGWYRELEIDGHDVSHHDPDWPASIKTASVGYMTRFAVFEFPLNSSEISRRAELERTVRYFAEHFSEYDTTDRLMEEMVRQGCDAALVYETESISTIAFGRMFFESHGVQYSPTVIRARRDGRIEADVPLMSIPAYNRARAIAAQLRGTMSAKDFQTLCLYSAESNAIVNGMEAAGTKLDLSKMTMFPCVVPDHGVSDRTMNEAMALLNARVERNRRARKKPWWKFW